MAACCVDLTPKPLEPPKTLLVPLADPNRLEPNGAVVASEADVLEPPNALELPAKAGNELEANVLPPTDDAPNAPVDRAATGEGETADDAADGPLLVLVPFSQLE